jgi:hypothetical protein
MIIEANIDNRSKIIIVYNVSKAWGGIDKKSYGHF